MYYVPTETLNRNRKIGEVLVVVGTLILVTIAVVKICEHLESEKQKERSKPAFANNPS